MTGRFVMPGLRRRSGWWLEGRHRAWPGGLILAEQLSTQRAATVAWIIDGMRDRAALREGITRRHAIDQVWLLINPAVYHRLTRYRGWGPARYEKRFTGTITRLLLD